MHLVSREFRNTGVIGREDYLACTFTTGGNKLLQDQLQNYTDLPMIPFRYLPIGDYG